MRLQVPEVTYADRLNEAWAQHEAPRADDAPTLISTFAGCGGSSLGFSMAGYRELMAVEWNAEAVKTFQRNFPEVDVYEGDIADLSVNEVLERTGLEPGQLDLFDGSPPCQGFSTAGITRCAADSRNQLFREFVRLLRGLRPRAFIMENVKGMVTGPMRPIFAECLRELKASGYTVTARLLDAQYFGVPQRRQRMIFIGARNDLGLTPTHPKPITRPTTVWQAIGHLGDTQDPAIGHTWIDESPAGRNTRTWVKAFKTKPGEKFCGYPIRHRYDRPAPTLTTGMPGERGNGAYLRVLGCHPQYTRVWSALEYRLLSSFPEQFVFPGPIGTVYKQCGNCVPPLLMRAVASHVRETLLD